MLYGLTCPSAPLQAGDCWACLHHSLASLAFAVGSRAQMDFCTAGIPLASAAVLAHHPVHAKVHLAVGHAVPTDLPCTMCRHVCQKWCACVCTSLCALACMHAHPHGQGGASPQGPSALLGMRGIWTTGRKEKEKEKGETLEKRGM